MNGRPRICYIIYGQFDLVFMKLMFLCFLQCFREQLRQEWVATQERVKNEEITITYSYWDGSGHRRQVRFVNPKKRDGLLIY